MSGRHDFTHAGRPYHVRWSLLPEGQWRLTLGDDQGRDFGAWVVGREVVGEEPGRTLPLLARVVANLAATGVQPLPKDA